MFPILVISGQLSSWSKHRCGDGGDGGDSDDVGDSDNLWPNKMSIMCPA